ncbi:MAG: polysaccharide biosynthesis/export family protein [Bacteroidales bacterium]|nr:polysaccharide biosynthesis/export family protein [Bacteroidales bacterium]
MKRLFKKNIAFLALALLLAVTSCTSYKKVPYLQNSQEFKDSAAIAGVSEPRIMPHDLLNITVINSQDQLTAMSYNLISPVDASRTGSTYSQPTLQNYLVDSNGYVEIPNVGTIHIAGLTIPEAEALVLEKVKHAFSVPPVVTVNFVDFKVSVLGEVTAPGTYTVKNGKVNVLQALALAKDMTIYGMRENVKVIREDANGKKEIHELDLNDASILNSPYYNLQQNDIVYVTPNKSKAKNSDVGSTTSLWFSATSILISLTSLMYNILK